MVRIAATLGLIFCLVVVGAAQSKNSSWLSGTWEGTAYQIDDGSIWTMKLVARGNRYSVTYPSLECGGVWRLVSINSRTARFKEKITHGGQRCVNNGSVYIGRLNKRQIAYRFSYTASGEITASAILRKAQLPRRT